MSKKVPERYERCLREIREVLDRYGLEFYDWGCYGDASYHLQPKGGPERAGLTSHPVNIEDMRIYN